MQIERDRLALAEREQRLEIAMQREVNCRLKILNQEARHQIEERYSVELRERDLRITQLRVDIEALRRRATQGSQQLQGEAQEITVEQTLKVSFPGDAIVPIRKGDPGADLLQRVMAPGGHFCDAILIESKRTKNWNGGWLDKLREDQRRSRAAHAVLVTRTPPTGLTTFKYIDGVWVTTVAFLVPVISMLRLATMQLAAMKQTFAGRQSKAELVYQYLIRGDFQHRVGTVADALHRLRSSHSLRRKRVAQDLANQEQEINAAESALMQLIGDFHGIAGISTPSLEGDSPESLAGAELAQLGEGPAPVAFTLEAEAPMSTIDCDLAK